MPKKFLKDVAKTASPVKPVQRKPVKAGPGKLSIEESPTIHEYTVEDMCENSNKTYFEKKGTSAFTDASMDASSPPSTVASAW